MKKIAMKNIFLLCAIFLLAGCAGQAGKAPESFGDAVRQNITAQTVNPEAAETNTRAPVYNGERAALAQKRYVFDAVEKPTAPKTSSGGGSGGQ